MSRKQSCDKITDRHMENSGFTGKGRNKNFTRADLIVSDPARLRILRTSIPIANLTN